MYRELQIKQKAMEDLQWKILRKYLSYFKSLRVGIMLELLSAQELLKNELYIDSISIKKELRGLGLGTKLLNYAENCARTKEFNIISLYVSNRNIKAITLYETLGYQKINEKNHDYRKEF
jgi:ribosomal protein S18 acetylase RimI-like enzyme